jgi:hypothetical protein
LSYTYFNYLAQAGGLTDFMFSKIPNKTEQNLVCCRLSVRFKVEHKFNNDAAFPYSYLVLDASKKNEAGYQQTVFQVLMLQDVS